MECQLCAKYFAYIILFNPSQLPYEAGICTPISQMSKLRSRKFR